MIDILGSTGEEIVETDHMMIVAEKAFAEVTAEKTGAAGDNDTQS
jgi:hypothetical protein